MQSLIPTLGWAAGGLTLVAGLPQVVKLIRTRDCDGVSSWTYTVWTLASVWWAAWALNVGAVPSYVVNLLCVPVLVTAVALLRPSRTQWVLLVASPFAAIALGLLWLPTLAVVASVFQAVIALPSLRTALRRGADLSGVAVGTWVLLIAGNVLWIAYDIGIGFALAGVVPVLSSATACAVIAKTAAHRAVHAAT